MKNINPNYSQKQVPPKLYPPGVKKQPKPKSRRTYCAHGKLIQNPRTLIFSGFSALSSKLTPHDKPMGTYTLLCDIYQGYTIDLSNKMTDNLSKRFILYQDFLMILLVNRQANRQASIKKRPSTNVKSLDLLERATRFELATHGLGNRDFRFL